ncbi:MAG: 3-hydroxyacyl-CoA dehydrogenase NAD-binding domain-containing protein [Bacteroidota bacterium]|nr:3-hydroxyacyl-CoA dehydrogenase NAD-binding domain-containing protein [Bacteroidota bacterium]MDP3145479.1 3-hydroxyacyl-CoA dehydrogenase NAD-binding domain-containing protein [Bacteroidota bacterium]MDP3556435.1 3-hydroxyacyl-CoA dehydrogenase NAD-binding domain-containing protein [Bacteroidota bacterium]
MFTKNSIVGVIGSGAMGSGIAQVAATASHKVIVYDNNKDSLIKAEGNLKTSLQKLVAKEKITAEQQATVISNISFVNTLNDLAKCDLVIEAIVENLQIKKTVFSELEKLVSESCVLASNTSSLSITSIAAACSKPNRVIGIHFFNPATIMPLVEIIPGIATEENITTSCQALISSWGKVTVIAKDTPGFIVNRVARPFYSEALRIYEEGIADMATIDWAMKEIAGFKMGPFELMDMIGHDVNYVVTETVWTQMYFDPKFKPALTQKRLLEAGFLGKKSGKGFYNYAPDAKLPEPKKDVEIGKSIVKRILFMLINEAADTLYLKVATREDIDLAMTKGVNYPKGLLKWADELGVNLIVQELTALKGFYEEDRYRISPLLKQNFIMKKTFY